MSDSLLNSLIFFSIEHFWSADCSAGNRQSSADSFFRFRLRLALHSCYGPAMINTGGATLMNGRGHAFMNCAPFPSQTVRVGILLEASLGTGTSKQDSCGRTTVALTCYDTKRFEMFFGFSFCSAFPTRRRHETESVILRFPYFVIAHFLMRVLFFFYGDTEISTRS